MKQLILPLLGVAAFIIVVGLLNQGKLIKSTKTITIGGVSVNIEIADNPEERSRGLSGRSSLAEGSGMLFVFEKKDVTPSFWMKDTLIPLDIIWINDGKIVKIDKNISNTDPKLYSPGTPVDYVLEVNAGFSDKKDLKIGDSAEGDSIQN